MKYKFVSPGSKCSGVITDLMIYCKCTIYRLWKMLPSILALNLVAHFVPSFRDAILNARRRECGKAHVAPSSPRVVPPLPLPVTPPSPSAICTSALQSVAGPAVLLLASARFEGRSRRAAGRGGRSRSRVPARPAPLRPGRLLGPPGL